MTQMNLPGKEAPAGHCSVPEYRLAYHVYTVARSRSSTLKVLTTVTQTETRRLNMTVQR